MIVFTKRVFTKPDALFCQGILFDSVASRPDAHPVNSK